jgi:hypothetical protein
METKIIKVTAPPAHGWLSELAKLAGCTRMTAYSAMYRNASGKKADRVRRMYQAKYENQTL